MRKSLLVGCLALVTAASHAQVVWGFSAPLLDGSQEVPPNSSIAYGTASFNVHDFFWTISGSVTITGLSVGQVLGMHIHHGAVGVNGPVIFDILANTAQSSQSGNVSNFFFTGTLQSDGNLTREQKLSVMAAGNSYINVHTAAFPGGEIRGQVDCVVPEPASFAAVGLGLGSLLLLRRRKG